MSIRLQSARAGLLLGALAAGALAQTNPIRVASSEWIADTQTSTNDPYVKRDGGAQGAIGGYIVQTYGDTSQCDDEADFDVFSGGSGCKIVAPNTIVADSYVANEVIDFDSPQPGHFCDPNGNLTYTGSNRLQISTVVNTGGTNGNTGVTYYYDLVQGGTNGCPNGSNGCPITNGVAAVTLDSNGAPQCNPYPGFWNPDDEPLWGVSAGVIGPLEDGFLYLQGFLSSSYPAAQGGTYNDLYLARVPHGEALSYDAYQYWNGVEYTTTRLVNPNQGGYSPAALINGVASYGSWFYSPYYEQYVVLGINKTAPLTGHDVLAWTAQKPEGPWSDPVTIYSNTSFYAGNGNADLMYSPNALPTYDNSGKTLTFVVSAYFRNSVAGVIKLTFE